MVAMLGICMNHVLAILFPAHLYINELGGMLGNSLVSNHFSKLHDSFLDIVTIMIDIQGFC